MTHSGGDQEFRGLVERLKQAVFLREKEDAGQLYGDILRRDPNFLLRGPAQYDLARLLEQGEHPALAFEAYRQLIDNQPENKSRVPALRAAGLLAYRLKRFVPASNFLKEFLSSDPSNIEREEAESVLGRIRNHAKKRQEAEEDFVNTPPEASHLKWDEVSTPDIGQGDVSSQRKAVYEDWHIPTESLREIAPKAAKARDDNGPKSGFMPKRIREQLEQEERERQEQIYATPPPPVSDYRPESVVAWKPTVRSDDARNPYEQTPHPPTNRQRFPTSPPPPATPLPPVQEPPYIQLDLPPAETPQTHLGPIKPMIRPPHPAPPMGGYYPAPAYPPQYPPAPPHYPGHPAPPQAPAPQYAPPNVHSPHEMGVPTPVPLPGMSMPTPFPAAPAEPAPAQQAPPSSNATPPPVQPSNETPAPAPAESPEERYSRLRNGRFALLLPLGKRIHLEEVADLVARNERVDRNEAKKLVLRRKGLIYDALTLDEAVKLEGRLKNLRQQFVFIHTTPNLKPMRHHRVSSATLHDKGIKMTSPPHQLKLRWEDVRLLNCGFVGRDGLISVVGGDPMIEYRFVQGTFDFDNFLFETHREFADTVRRFVRQIAEKAGEAKRSVTVQHLLDGKARQPQTFASDSEYENFTLWLIYNHFGESVDAGELGELGRLASKW